MAERLGKARIIRIGAERLRRLAANESSPEAAREMLRIAGEMDEYAAELEQSFANRPPKLPKDVVA
jgi:hypothetical protein